MFQSQVLSPDERKHGQFGDAGLPALSSIFRTGVHPESVFREDQDSG